MVSCELCAVCCVQMQEDAAVWQANAERAEHEAALLRNEARTLQQRAASTEHDLHAMEAALDEAEAERDGARQRCDSEQEMRTALQRTVEDAHAMIARLQHELAASEGERERAVSKQRHHAECCSVPTLSDAVWVDWRRCSWRRPSTTSCSCSMPT